MLFMIEGVVDVGPLHKDTGQLIHCLSFKNAILGDYEVMNNEPAYTNFRAKDRVVALAIPDKPLKIILDSVYSDLKKDMLAKVCYRHLLIRRDLRSNVKKLQELEES